MSQIDPALDETYHQKYLALLQEIKKEFPHFAIVYKYSSKFSRLLQRIMFWNKKFNVRYTTTIGPKVYVNYTWDMRGWRTRYDVLIHERIHQRQTRKFGLLVFFLIYGLVPFPLMLAYFRKKWEAEAYEINIYMDLKDKGRKYVYSEKYQKHLLDQFCGPFYLFTWYSQSDILRWLVQTVRAIESGKLTWEILTNRRRTRPIKKDFDVPWLLKWLYPEEFTNPDIIIGRLPLKLHGKEL